MVARVVEEFLGLIAMSNCEWAASVVTFVAHFVCSLYTFVNIDNKLPLLYGCILVCILL